MKFSRTILSATLIFIGTIAGAEEVDIQKLGWLEGLWTGTKNGIETEERWSSAKGGALLGTHRDVKKDRMISYEFLRIDTTKEGTFYFASPRSQTPTPFKLVSMDVKRVVFENNNHDFPKRILYWLDQSGALHARIEGSLRGKEVVEEWVWRKSVASGSGL
jgi:hypothetical protein